jgi:protein TonB
MPGGPDAGGPMIARAREADGGAAPAEYGPYLRAFRQRVQEAQSYPLAARRQRLEGRVELDILIDQGGRVADARVATPSPHAILDEAALATVRGLVPIPLPEHLSRRPLRIRLPLEFRLR